MLEPKRRMCSSYHRCLTLPKAGLVYGTSNALARDTLANMSDRQLALRSKIGELMALLETIQSKHIQSMAVLIDDGNARTYSIVGLRDALSGLVGEVNASSESTISAIEEKYEHDRADVLRIVGRLSEIVAASATGDEYGPVTKQVSTF